MCQILIFKTINKRYTIKNQLAVSKLLIANIKDKPIQMVLKFLSDRPAFIVSTEDGLAAVAKAFASAFINKAPRRLIAGRVLTI